MNKKSNLLIKILLAIIVFTVTVIGLINCVDAKSYSSLSSLMSGKHVGDTITVGFKNNGVTQLTNNKNLYCVQKGAHIKSIANKYTVKKYVKIVGKKATFNNGTTTTNKENATIAYILGGGSYPKGYGTKENYTSRQLALYEYWNTWAGTSGWAKSNGNSSAPSTSTSRKIISNAQAYASSSTTDASIKSNVGSKITTSNVEIGPINVTYTGNISSITIKDNNGKEVTSGITFVQEGKTVSASNISSRKDFYIKNTSGKMLKDVTINVKADDVITAEIWLLQSGNKQKLIAAKSSKSPSSAKVTIEIEQLGSLTITKQDAKDSSKKLVAGFKIQTSEGYLSGNIGGPYKYDNKKSEDATIYYTDENGTLTLTNIKLRSYKPWEVIAPEGYTLEDQTGYKTRKESNGIGAITGVVIGDDNGTKVTSANTNVTLNAVNEEFGSITVNKADSNDTNIKLNAGFKVKTENGWLSGKAGSYNYSSTYENATTYYTTDGKLTLKRLSYGSYSVYEVVAPEGYELDGQDGYNAENKWVECQDENGETIIQVMNSSNKNITFNLLNSNLINIGGYVWTDIPETKEQDSNSLYDDNEQKVEGVTVLLKEKSTRNTVATTTTKADGSYLFEEIRRPLLSKYYIEFDYSKTDYKSYIPVAFDNTNAKGSRALYDEVPENDKKLNGIVNTYTGTEKESEYGLSGKIFTNFYNKDNSTLENINLGIKQLPETSYTLQQDIVNAEINLGGIKYTYTYGQRGNKDYEGVPTVNWQDENDIRAYTADIYPSDIANIVENSENNEDIYNNIDVKVKYKIDITNTTTYNIEELYVENLLKIDEVKNLFDNTRYELADSNWENPTSEDGITTVTMKDSYKEQIYGEGIDSNNTKTAEITFKVNPEAIIEILKNPSGIIEDYPTKAVALAYHEYERKDYSWSNDISKVQTHQTNSTKEEDTAPYLVFKLGNQRAVSGVVFEDKISSTNGEALGNGYLDDDESKLKDIKVDLIDENGEVVKLYHTLTDTSTEYTEYTDYTTSSEASTTTDSNGNYSFVGILPTEQYDEDGKLKDIKYHIRFTYEDGTRKIADYKSTVVTSKKVQDVIKGTDTSKDWYKDKDIEEKNYSVAVDNLGSREKYNQNNADVTKMIAETPIIGINADYSNAENLKIGTTDCYVYDVFNFGIIRQPEQRLDISKNITNIKITNTQGNIVLEGNPAEKVMAGVTTLNLDGNATGYVRIEIPEEEIYGSKLTITYAITVTNNSDLNYYEDESNEHYGWYYMFGYKDSDTKEVTLKANEVLEYLDPLLTYVSTDSEDQVEKITKGVENSDGIVPWVKEDGTEITGDELTKLQELIASQERYMRKQHSREDKYASILSITNWEELYSTKTAKESVKTQDVVEIVAERTLSTEDDDMEFISTTEIITAEPIASSLVSKTVETQGKIDSTVSIMPPTGADMQTIVIYAVAGLCAIIILGVGIVIIKKKIL